jgi:hypothetical protein
VSGVCRSEVECGGLCREGGGSGNNSSWHQSPASPAAQPEQHNHCWGAHKAHATCLVQLDVPPWAPGNLDLCHPLDFPPELQQHLVVQAILLTCHIPTTPSPHTLPLAPRPPQSLL